MPKTNIYTQLGKKPSQLTTDEKKMIYGLRKAWRGYTIARAKGDEKQLVHYAEGIRKFQKALGLKEKAYTIPKKTPKYVNGVMHRKGEKKVLVIEGII